MREFNAPMTVYVASDFAEGRGRLWWVALEKLLAHCDTLDLTMNGIDIHYELYSRRRKTSPSANFTTGCAACRTTCNCNMKSAGFARVTASTTPASRAIFVCHGTS